VFLLSLSCLLSLSPLVFKGVLGLRYIVAVAYVVPSASLGDMSYEWGCAVFVSWVGVGVGVGVGGWSCGLEVEVVGGGCW
jgi:hypothetical protein